MEGTKRESTCCAFNKFLSQTQFTAVFVVVVVVGETFPQSAGKVEQKKETSVRRKTQPRSLPFI